MGDLRIDCLGGIFITKAGREVVGFHSAKAKALLGYLAVTRRTHSRLALADLLWPDLTEKSARANLRKVLSNLRNIVGESVTISRDAVECRTDLLDSDVAELEKLLASEGVSELERAVELYRGDFLHGFYVQGVPSFEEWSLGERTRLREEAVGATERLIQHLVDEGKLDAGRSLYAPPVDHGALA